MHPTPLTVDATVTHILYPSNRTDGGGSFGSVGVSGNNSREPEDVIVRAADSDHVDVVDVELAATTTPNCSNNVYCVSDEQYVDMIREFIRPTTFEWCLIAFYFAVFVVGIVGNVLVCFVVWNDRRMRTVTNLFIVNLSVADFLVIVVCLPPTVLGDVTETWYMGSVMCKVVIYLQGVSVSVSVLTLTVISIERYYAICHPLKFKATTRRARTMIGLIWLISGVILLPDVVVLDTFRRFPAELQTDLLTTCKPAWEYHHQMAFQLFLIVALYVVPFVIMGAAYTSIAICLWSTVIPSEPVTTTTASDFQPSVYSRHHSDSTSHLPRIKDAHYQMLSRRKVAKMLIAVVVMFGVCYLPVHLLNILRYAQVGMKDDTGVIFALIAHWLCYFNSAINPVIYNFMSEKFQRAFSDVLHCRCRLNRHSNSYGATGALSTAHYADTRMATWKRAQQQQQQLNHHHHPPCPV